VCFLCDLALITVGVLGAAAFFATWPILKSGISVVGVTFLFIYGLRKLRDPGLVDFERSPAMKRTLLKSALLAMSFSILNPHAYLDAFILIGGIAAKFEDERQRLSFGFGAAVYSGIWFVVLSLGSYLLKPVFEDQPKMRVLMKCSCLALLCLSGKLALDLVELPVIGSELNLKLPDSSEMPIYSSIIY
jgi:L-lysine exporter family protein LysE/ArgO